MRFNGGMQHIDALQVAARLDRRALIEALDQAFRQSHEVPARQQHHVQSGRDDTSTGTLLIMPAWDSAALGIKIVTVFPDNAQRGLPAVCASYLMLDAVSGAPRALLDGSELTLRRTAAASALASRHLSRPAAARLLKPRTSWPSLSASVASRPTPPTISRDRCAGPTS
jgi:alanine dehydrogenase